MQVIECAGFGGPGVLRLSERKVPQPQHDEILIKVAFAGVNRADMLQRRGKYPPPKDTSDILGMEVSGRVAAIGPDVTKWKVGDELCALLGGGGYAEYVCVSQNHCLPVPATLSLKEAAALPEAVITVYTNIFESGALKKTDRVLIHGGSSGIGTTAIQMVKLFGATVYVTAGSEEKCAACHKLGASLAINYNTNDFTKVIERETKGEGVDIILDMVGGTYVGRNLSILAPKGRHISIATQSGGEAVVDLRQVMTKQLTITGSTLRGRDKAEKARLVLCVEAEIWPYVVHGQLKPLIYQSFLLKNAAEAHKMMESGVHIGKMVLEVS